MKLNLKFLAIVFSIGIFFTSCREEKTQEEKLIEEMKDAGAEYQEEGDDDGNVEIKMETENKEVKIEKKADGKTEIKIETDDN